MIPVPIQPILFLSRKAFLPGLKLPVDCGNATHRASINRKNPKINIENARIIDRRVTLQGGFVPKQTLTGNYEKCEKFWTPSLIMQNAMIVVPWMGLLFLKKTANPAIERRGLPENRCYRKRTRYCCKSTIMGFSSSSSRNLSGFSFCSGTSISPCTYSR